MPRLRAAVSVRERSQMRITGMRVNPQYSGMRCDTLHAVRDAICMFDRAISPYVGGTRRFGERAILAVEKGNLRRTLVFQESFPVMEDLAYTAEVRLRYPNRPGRPYYLWLPFAMDDQPPMTAIEHDIRSRFHFAPLLRQISCPISIAPNQGKFVLDLGEVNRQLGVHGLSALVFYEQGILKCFLEHPLMDDGSVGAFFGERVRDVGDRGAFQLLLFPLGDPSDPDRLIRNEPCSRSSSLLVSAGDLPGVETLIFRIVLRHAACAFYATEPSQIWTSSRKIHSMLMLAEEIQTALTGVHILDYVI